MRKLLYLLIALLGFTVTTSCRELYSCPEVEFQEKEEQDSDNNEQLEQSSEQEATNERY